MVHAGFGNWLSGNLVKTENGWFGKILSKQANDLINFGAVLRQDKVCREGIFEKVKDKMKFYLKKGKIYLEKQNGSVKPLMEGEFIPETDYLIKGKYFDQKKNLIYEGIFQPRSYKLSPDHVGTKTTK